MSDYLNAQINHIKTWNKLPDSNVLCHNDNQICNLVISVTPGPVAKQLDNAMPKVRRRNSNITWLYTRTRTHTQLAEEKFNGCVCIDADYPQVFGYIFGVCILTHCRLVFFFFSFLQSLFLFMFLSCSVNSFRQCSLICEALCLDVVLEIGQDEAAYVSNSWSHQGEGEIKPQHLC